LAVLNREFVLSIFVLVVISFASMFLFGPHGQINNIQSHSPGFDEATTGESRDIEPVIDLSYLVDMDPAHVDNSNLPVTPTDQLHITGSAPRVDITEYRLVIDGLVNKNLTYTYDEILEYPAVTRVVLLICPSVFADNAEWTGIQVATILDEADVKPEATTVTFYAVDGYRITLSLKDALGDGVFLAYKVNGQALPREHGYPLRLVVTGRYGANWVKWVERIEVK
jgi:DMSO/TMAO reductase YedYZ molybdopterin-dependent catalytic subunit